MKQRIDFLCNTGPLYGYKTSLIFLFGPNMCHVRVLALSSQLSRFRTSNLGENPGPDTKVAKPSANMKQNLRFLFKPDVLCSYKTHPIFLFDQIRNLRDGTPRGGSPDRNRVSFAQKEHQGALIWSSVANPTNSTRAESGFNHKSTNSHRINQEMCQIPNDFQYLLHNAFRQIIDKSRAK